MDCDVVTAGGTLPDTSFDTSCCLVGLGPERPKVGDLGVRLSLRDNLDISAVSGLAFNVGFLLPGPL